MQYTTLALLATTAFSMASALPSINLGSYTFPSGGQLIAWDASISSSDACNQHTIVTGSDGGPAPPRCGTDFTLDGISKLSLTCASDGETITGVALNGTLVETCSSVNADGTFCEDGVELTQMYACVPV
ncbi:hypothetical protein PVAR5_4198 [Paecilomyces variotii No. 5]|uniref:Cyanovirin-N domain-containing protein n=1 Tax=Byssochlamys spectabilis (strain No. 5 / NBRC 109023) TaxID=1356009 RepID=V5FDY3_BYSSN|nr:hypothetical protein PVAR5_4198 [Paecilomyces variotii No. 5]